MKMMMKDKIKLVIDYVINITLIVVALLLMVKLINDIRIQNELRFPGECIEVNQEYYCRNIVEEKDKGIKL